MHSTVRAMHKRNTYILPYFSYFKGGLVMLRDIRTATITQKGQISIPKEARKKASFREGDKVAVLAYTDRIEIRPLKQLSKGLQTALASESVLAKEWNTPEEDEAWKDL